MQFPAKMIVVKAKKYKIIPMNLFSKKFLKIILTAVIFTGGLLFNNIALAQSDGGNLTVEIWDSLSSSWVSFNSQSLFSEANFLPGESVSNWAKVTNNSGQPQRVVAESINSFNPVINSGTGERFGDILRLTIKNENITVLYNETFSDFFSAGEIYLGDITTGSTIHYDFNVSFEESAGDGFQGKSLGFDMLIGFQGVGGKVLQGEDGDEDGLLPGLIIQNPREFNINTSQATIEWMTSYNSTSRVIYDTNSEVFDLNNPPNYGYAYSSIEKDNIFPISEYGVINHSVVLNNLLSGTIYYYRAISHASPPSITEERSFATLDPSSSSVKKSGGKSSHKHYRKNKKLAGNILASSLNSNGSEDEEKNEEASVVDSSSPSSEIRETEKENGEVAGEHGRDCKGRLWWIWALALIVYIILFNFNNFYGEQKREKIRWFWEALYTIVALSLWNMFDQCHINIWFPCLIIIVGLLSYGYYLWGMKKASRQK